MIDMHLINIVKIELCGRAEGCHFSVLVIVVLLLFLFS
jgi:hypothetical protein